MASDYLTAFETAMVFFIQTILIQNLRREFSWISIRSDYIGFAIAHNSNDIFMELHIIKNPIQAIVYTRIIKFLFQEAAKPVCKNTIEDMYFDFLIGPMKYWTYS